MKANNTFGSIWLALIIVIVSASLTLVSQAAYGQKKKAEPKAAAEVKPEPKRKARPPRPPRPRLPAIEPYFHELTMAVRYDFATGSVQSAEQSSSTKLSESVIGTSFTYGALVSDHIEPLFEAEYQQSTREVADYKSEETLLNIGLGMLVNLPQVPDEVIASGYRRTGELSDFMAAKWIPFFGFIMGKSIVEDSRGVDTKAKVEDSGMVTKLVFGTRYMIYPHVSINFVARMLYEDSSSEARVGDTKGATRSKMKLETRLLSLSLFM